MGVKYIKKNHDIIAEEWTSNGKNDDNAIYYIGGIILIVFIGAGIIAYKENLKNG